jgi:DNA-binding PadR family transcriptional regulator
MTRMRSGVRFPLRPRCEASGAGRRVLRARDEHEGPQPGRDVNGGDRDGPFHRGLLLRHRIALAGGHTCSGTASGTSQTRPTDHYIRQYTSYYRCRWHVTEPSLSAGDWAVLGAVAEEPTHGFAVARLLGEEAPLGRVWTMRRQDVYQALKKLSKLELIAERTTEPGDRGPKRTILAVTPSGDRLLRRWLSEPVDHVRDVRSLLLLKLLLLDRSGRDPVPLLDAQRAKLVPLLGRLEALRASADGFERVIADWRVTSCRATLQFIDDLLAD